ncbi:hypothetical protein LTS10_011864 [Elasticomyces elasticus]|nr:hypothetical protein LTS10_011864 [Elasticomyces elasticus]
MPLCTSNKPMTTESTSGPHILIRNDPKPDIPQDAGGGGQRFYLVFGQTNGLDNATNIVQLLDEHCEKLEKHNDNGHEDYAADSGRKRVRSVGKPSNITPVNTVESTDDADDADNADSADDTDSADTANASDSAIFVVTSGHKQAYKVPKGTKLDVGLLDRLTDRPKKRPYARPISAKCNSGESLSHRAGLERHLAGNIHGGLLLDLRSQEHNDFFSLFSDSLIVYCYQEKKKFTVEELAEAWKVFEGAERGMSVTLVLLHHLDILHHRG